jgi:16S rRNA (cytidine1402-2'-O)-methyltransferase
LGNLQDFSPRGIHILKEVHTVFSEHPDTSKKLCNALNIHPPRWRLLDQHNEAQLTTEVVEESQKHPVAVLSRAGMPGVNDPGTVLVRHMLDHHIDFDLIPGPSIASCLMTTSGRFGPFFYFGYFPKKPSQALHQLFVCSNAEATALYLESPHRLSHTLLWLKTTLKTDPKAEVVLVHELTKVHQRIVAVTLPDLDLKHLEAQMDLSKGEWGISLHLSQPLSEPYTWVKTQDLKTLLSKPYPSTLQKFAKRYGLQVP